MDSKTPVTTPQVLNESAASATSDDNVDMLILRHTFKIIPHVTTRIGCHIIKSPAPFRCAQAIHSKFAAPPAAKLPHASAFDTGAPQVRRQ